MTRPIGVTIIVIVAFIRALWDIFLGLTAVGFGTFALLGGMDPNGVAFWTAVVSLVVGTITLVLAMGLWNLAAWAWMWTVIIQGIRLIVDLVPIFTGGQINWIGLILSGIIVIYLLLPGVRSAFMK